MKLAIPLLAALLTLPTLATAQDVAPRRAPVQGVVIRVRGDVQRPYAFAVTGRAPLGYTALDDHKTFAPEVTQAVRRDPF
jgi:hypothetical protein